MSTAKVSDNLSVRTLTFYISVKTPEKRTTSTKLQHQWKKSFFHSFISESVTMTSGDGKFDYDSGCILDFIFPPYLTVHFYLDVEIVSETFLTDYKQKITFRQERMNFPDILNVCI